MYKLTNDNKTATKQKNAVQKWANSFAEYFKISQGKVFGESTWQCVVFHGFKFGFKMVNDKLILRISVQPNELDYLGLTKRWGLFVKDLEQINDYERVYSAIHIMMVKAWKEQAAELSLNDGFCIREDGTHVKLYASGVGSLCVSISREDEACGSSNLFELKRAMVLLNRNDYWIYDNSKKSKFFEFQKNYELVRPCIELEPSSFKVMVNKDKFTQVDVKELDTFSRVKKAYMPLTDSEYIGVHPTPSIMAVNMYLRRKSNEHIDKNNIELSA